MLLNNANYREDLGIWIYPRTDIHESAHLGVGVCVGVPPGPDDDLPEYHGLTTRIGPCCYVEPYVLIYSGAVLVEHVSIDPYSRIGHRTTIGSHTRIVYGARIHNDVKIGSNCVIGGNCSDRVVIGDNVVHMGRICHKFNAPHKDWAETEEPSPVIKDRAVIGANALLIGAITIGENSYVGAGEIVRQSVPAYCVVYGGKLYKADEWKGSLVPTGFFNQ